jgi:hypothetical protein
MTRPQRSVAIGGEMAAFSPDGSRFATVVWKGDLRRNVNVHSLLIHEDHAMCVEDERIARDLP